MLVAFLIQAPTTPLRIGDVGRQLTEQDVVAIEMVLPAKPWLLSGERTWGEHVEAYLAPTTTAPALRRGTVIGLMRRTVSEWSVVQRTWSYAQVAIPGRRFDEIDGDQDVNRPFYVLSSFDDDELVRIVQLIRSNPPTRGTPIQAWPIRSIQRKEDGSVDVLLRETSTGGQAVKVREVGQDWIIMGTGTWDT